MQASQRLVSLIDSASMRAGNDSQLAKMIEATRGNVHDWRKGERPCPLEAQVLMAPLAGADVDQVIRDALIEKHANTPRGEKLVSALGKGLMGAGVLTVSIASGSDALASSIPVGIHLLRCILC